MESKNYEIGKTIRNKKTNEILICLPCTIIGEKGLKKMWVEEDGGCCFDKVDKNLYE